MKRVYFTALIFLSCFNASAEVYKWTDENGKLHFSDKKPEQNVFEQIKLTINTYTHVSFDLSMFDTGQDEQEPARKKVVMYSTEWCGYCKKARDFFNQNHIPFTEYDIEKDAGARKQYQEMGATGVPVILVGKNRMNGFSRQGFERIYH